MVPSCALYGRLVCFVCDFATVASVFLETKAGTGAGYDLSVTTFSPDGRVFQVPRHVMFSSHSFDFATFHLLHLLPGGVCRKGC